MPRLIIFTFVSLFLISTHYSFASDNIFNYAGLSANTNENELKARYSTSEFRSNYVKLSEIDSHDYIRSILLVVTDHYKYIRITFGKELTKKADESRHFFYPPCKGIYNKLKQQYGKENDYFEHYEGESEMKSRKYTWKHKNESLVLSCFQSDNEFKSECVLIGKE